MHEDSASKRNHTLIDKARSGDVQAQHKLCEKVFAELHLIAKRLLPAMTLQFRQPCWYMIYGSSYSGKGGLKKTENRRYFFAVAADQMRIF